MSRPAIFVTALIVAAAATSAAILVVRSNEPQRPHLSEEQRLTRQTVFGSSNEPPPIEKGQKMRPRW
ncbi:entry exclusion protein TrbK [Pararhizobium antarcticum]|uniref:entry exclusion protein TrbK n=1 Tax=Pararhizobium antarcticum TaxID=1798805 RepID=UPI0008FFAD47|nr:entry exclusion protein TrbK [Pararhizobium antarcticum]